MRNNRKNKQTKNLVIAGEKMTVATNKHVGEVPRTVASTLSRIDRAVKRFRTSFDVNFSTKSVRSKCSVSLFYSDLVCSGP